MADWQIESDACIGRGFAAVDPTGICSKYYTWVTKAAVSGGPGWNILLDKSASPVQKTFTGANVDIALDRVTIASHGYYTGEKIVLSNSGGALPGGLVAGTYYVVKVGTNEIAFSNSIAEARAGTIVDISTVGTGTHETILDGPYIVVSDVAAPALNEVCFVTKIGYVDLEAGFIRVQHFLGWDSVNTIPVGLWDGRRIATVDAGPYAYDFRGGAEGMVIQSRIGTDWDTAGIDTFTGSINFLEADTVVTDLTAQGTAGSTVNLTVTSSTGFNTGSFYFIFDNATGGVVNYVECTDVPDGTHVEVDTLYDTFPIGAVIGAYPHRFYTFGTTTGGGLPDLNASGTYKSHIPYMSAADGYVFHNQSSLIYGAIEISKMQNALITQAPGDDLNYAVQKGFVCERYGNNTGIYTTSMNRDYGITNNTYVTSDTSLAKAQDGRTIGGVNYLYFQRDDEAFSNGSSAIAVLILDTETP